jgi:uncharacterized protein involved in exopolysaccharide biosynthesis
MQVGNEEQDISLMDLLLVLAENIKLLLIGPLLVGLVALAIAFGLPQSFTSQAILALPAAPQPKQALEQPQAAKAAAILVSPLVLDPVIKTLNLAEGLSMEGARIKLAGQIKPTVGKDGLLRLDATAVSPVEAQKIGNAVIDAWLQTTIPRGQDHADLEARLAYAKTALASVTRTIERMTSDGSNTLNRPVTFSDAGTSVVALGELQARFLGEVLSDSRALQGLPRDVVIQPPTFPTIAVAPKKSLIAVLAALASGFVLLLWVFVRRAWKSSAQDPQGAEKQARLRAALGFKARQP